MPLDPTRFARAGTLAPRETHPTRLVFDVGFPDNEAVPALIEIYGDGVVRLRLGPQERPDYGLTTGMPQPIAAPVPDGATMRVTAGEAALVVRQDPLRIVLERNGRPLLASITDEHFRGWTRLPAFGHDGDRWLVSLALDSGEPVYGLGEKFSSLNRRGQLLHSQVDDALGVNTGLAYKNVPFCWSPRGWGVFINTPGRVSHGVGHPEWSHRSYAAIVEDEALDVFFIAASTPAGILMRYTALTGRAPEVPLWGLGLWVSRAYYQTADEALDVAKSLRAHEIPCDVLTLDGRAAWEVRTRFDFRWDASRYPDPEVTLSRLRDQGLRVCVWEYPYVSIHSPRHAELAARGYFLKTRDGRPYVFDWDPDPTTSAFGEVLTRLPPSSIIDFTHPEASAFWRDEHKALFDAGVDVMKVDFGEHVPDDCVAHNGDSGRRLHNVYPLLYNRCVYEATGLHHRGAPMVWGRASWTGAQRYPIQWGGDPQSDWEGMCASIRGGLAWGLSGVPFHSTDIGGFYGAQQPDAELYVRWLQWSVFSSHMRLHGIGAREPWAFGPEAETIARRWIRFRYRLLPYLKAMCDEASISGLPVMRAMPLAFADDRLCWGFEEQFLCGDCLLIAPVKQSGGEVDVYLPRGDDWIDLDTGLRHSGGTSMRCRAGLHTIPHFGRVGYLLPLGPEVESSDAIDIHSPLDEVWVFGRLDVAREGFSQLTFARRGGERLEVGFPGGTVRRYD